MILIVSIGQDAVIGAPPAPNTAQQLQEVQFVQSPQHLPKSGQQVNWTLTAKETDETIAVTGFAGVKARGAEDPPGIPQDFFVTSHGGEYFFVPPIKTLKTWACNGKTAALYVQFSIFLLCDI